MFFSVSGVAKQELAREADRFEREADSLERDREADRLARKRVARECRGLGVGQCIVTALVSTVSHAPLAWNSGPIPTFTPNNGALCPGLLDSSVPPPPPPPKQLGP